MTDKKIEPTNPDKNTPAEAKDGDKAADRKTNGFRIHVKKSGRKTNAMRFGKG